MSKQDLGCKFETQIHELLQLTKLTNKNILREKDIKKYSVHITGIDHLIDLDDFCIAIQDKYVHSHKPTNTDIHHFKTCVNDLSKILKKKIYGIYLSILEPTAPAKKSIEYENSLKNNEFNFMHHENKEKLVFELLQFLYSKNIYLYEENDTVMLNENENYLNYLN